MFAKLRVTSSHIFAIPMLPLITDVFTTHTCTELLSCNWLVSYLCQQLNTAANEAGGGGNVSCRKHFSHALPSWYAAFLREANMMIYHELD